MSDRLDNIEQALLAPKSKGQIWRTGTYTLQETQSVSEFMHSDFPHKIYGGGRLPVIKVEYPPSSICLPAEWEQKLNLVLIPELSVFHPAYRQKLTIVRFVPNFIDSQNIPHYGGQKNIIESEYFVRITTHLKDNSPSHMMDCMYFLMHELIEGDFWLKTRPNDPEVPSDEQSETLIISSDYQAYRYLLDEKVANRRAIRALRRAWSRADWYDPNDIYEEDK